MNESTTPLPAPTKRERRFRRLVIGVVVLAALLIVVAVGFRITAEVMLHSTQRSVAASGHPTNVDELLARYRAPRDGINAAEIYERALALFREPEEVLTERVPVPEAFRTHPRWSHLWEEYERQGDGHPPPMMPMHELLPDRSPVQLDKLGQGDPWPDKVIDAIRRYLAVHEEAIELLLEATEADYYLPDRDYHVGGVELLLPELRPMRQGATLLSMKRDVALLDGRVDEAIDLLEAMFRHAAMLDDELMLIGQLVRISLHAQALAGVESILNLGEPTDEHLDRLEAIIHRARTVPDPTLLMVGETVLMDRTILRLRETAAGPVLVLSAFSGHLSLNRAYLLRWNRAALDILDKPIEEWMDHLPIDLPPEFLLRTVLRIVGIVIPSSDHVLVTACRAEGLHRTAKIALAVERFRRAEGRPPESLDDLVPAYLSEVPVNPYPTPLEYQVFDGGYVLGFRARRSSTDEPLVEKTEHGRWRLRPESGQFFLILQ
ncbi:MAG: hypothetical protein JJU36_11675 [Phycisphaeraceae bacterium]|nr:hypothetical protein [Phycisphaeraceae bacterium]